MMALTDDSTLKQFEMEESAEPSCCKSIGDRVIYESRALEIPDEPGYPILCDFGDAQFGKEEYPGEVMPDLYRAPEIVLGIPWNEKIDIWAVGLMVGYRKSTSVTTTTNRAHQGLGLFRRKAHVQRTTSQ